MTGCEIRPWLSSSSFFLRDPRSSSVIPANARTQGPRGDIQNLGLFCLNAEPYPSPPWPNSPSFTFLPADGTALFTPASPAICQNASGSIRPVRLVVSAMSMAVNASFGLRVMKLWKVRFFARNVSNDGDGNGNWTSLRRAIRGGLIFPQDWMVPRRAALGPGYFAAQNSGMTGGEIRPRLSSSSRTRGPRGGLSRCVRLWVPDILLRKIPG